MFMLLCYLESGFTGPLPQRRSPTQMRKILSKLCPLALAGAMLLSAVPAFALWSDAYGDQLTAVPTQLQEGRSW